MVGFFYSVAEAVVEKGVRGLLDEVPFGRYFCDVAERVMEKEKARRQRGELRTEFAQIIALGLEAAQKEAREAFAEALGRSGVRVPEAEVGAAAEWVAGIPEAARVSNRRPDDPSGRTLSAAFAIDTPDDILKVLPPRPPRFLVGQDVPGREGEWRLDRVLGIGGFGEVWLTRHAHDYHAPRAVKFFFDQTGKDVQREAALVKRAMDAGRADAAPDDDPRRHIVPILDVRLTSAAPWLMYEYVAGGNLSGWVHQLSRRSGGERVAQVVAAMKQLCRGAGVFHRLPAPLAHRDLKPSNVLIDATTKKLRITDFGIGAVTQRAANSRESRGESTQGERFVSYLRGAHTPTYSSPEQRRGDPPDPRDDVHALGVICYQLLVGDLAAAPGADLADDLREAGSPDALIDLVAACVARKPERRPADAVHLAKRLDAIRTPGRAVPVPPPQASEPTVPKVEAPELKKPKTETPVRPAERERPPVPHASAEPSEPTGAVAPERGAPAPRTRRRRRTALLLGGLIATGLAVAAVAVFVVPVIQTARVKARAVEDLKQIGLGIQNFHGVFNRLPNNVYPPTFGAKDAPLLSWRVMVLPYIGEKALYDEFRLDEPWDSPANRRLVARMPRVYQGSLAENTGTTAFKMFTDPQPRLDRWGKNFSTITDGTSNTIAVVESGEPVEWTRPADIPFDGKTLPSLAPVGGGDELLTLMFDGSVRWVNLKQNAPKALIEAITPNGGEVNELK